MELYPIHPLADCFPRMPGPEFVLLKKDIRENGLIEPIWVYDGKVLDGRHRQFACQEVGVEPRYRQYEGSNPLGFVISLNLNRRHLSESQRAMVAAGLANMPAHRPDDNCANLRTSQDDAAEMLQVSRRSVQTAAKVERTAPAEVVEAVKAGNISLNMAGVIPVPFSVFGGRVTWCPGRDLNPYAQRTADFKSAAYTDSATRAGYWEAAL